MLHLHPSVVPFLKCQLLSQPAQGLLIGSRAVLINGGPYSLVKRFVPISSHGQELSSLVNFYMNPVNALLGWAIVVHQDIDAEECAIAYFRSLLIALCRVIPANCSSLYDPMALAKEIHQLVHQMHGLVVFHAEQGSELESEFVCFSPDIPLTLIQELVSGHSIFDPEENILLLASDKIVELDPVQYEVLGQVQEEGQLKDVLAAANIEFGGAASSRKARKHRSTVSGEAGDEVQKEIKVKKVPFDLLHQLDVVELIDSYCKTSCNGLVGMGIDTITTEQTRSEDTEAESAKSYAEKMAEYEVLLTWFKVLSQPDDVILKKISSFEDYEDRMKKLGAKLKHSLSPEDLIKTLASIQPTPTLTKESSK